MDKPFKNALIIVSQQRHLAANSRKPLGSKNFLSLLLLFRFVCNAGTVEREKKSQKKKVSILLVDQLDATANPATTQLNPRSPQSKRVSNNRPA